MFETVIYIAGKVTGNPKYKEEFAEEERRIKALGHEVINPVKIEYPSTATHETIMEVCYKMLDMADGIYLMKGWAASAGAVKELKYFLSTKDISHVYAYGGDEVTKAV